MERMIVEGRDLTITTLNKTDNGTYRCEASNHLGTSSAEYILFVYGEYSNGYSCYGWSVLLHLRFCAALQLRNSGRASEAHRQQMVRRSDRLKRNHKVQKVNVTLSMKDFSGEEQKAPQQLELRRFCRSLRPAETLLLTVYMIFARNFDCNHKKGLIYAYWLRNHVAKISKIEKEIIGRHE